MLLFSFSSIKVGDREEELIFSSDRSKGDGFRRVSMERVAGSEVISKEARITYDLSGNELLEMMQSAGFREIHGINDAVGEEKHFDVWLARK